MTRRTITGTVMLLLIVVAAQAHDLFLKLDSYFLQPNATAVVRVLNGTFQKSDGAVARDRLANLSLRGPGLNAANAESIIWRAEEKASVMEIQTGDPGNLSRWHFDQAKRDCTEGCRLQRVSEA